PVQGAQRAEDHRPRRWRLRRLLQLLPLRPEPEAQRSAARRPGPHGQGVHPADGQVHPTVRSIEGSNRIHSGVLRIVILVLIVGVGQSLTSVPTLFAQPTYYGLFTDSGGLNTGDKVRIAGMDVGTVDSLVIDGDHVRMGFSLGGNQIGTDSRLAIRTDTILGK